MCFSVADIDGICLFTGIHVLTRSGNRLSCVVYNLSTGKVKQVSVFPTDTQAFLGAPPHTKITLHNGEEVME